MSAEASHDADACAAMGAVTEAHARFGPFVGTFRAEVTMWMGPGDPMVSHGTMTNTLELGGRFLQHVYTGDPSGGPFPDFRGRGYWGYNTIAKRYEGFWIDTACTFFQTEQGQVDETGRVWTMHSEMLNPSTGKPMRKRTLITLVDDDRHEMESSFDMGDGAWVRSMRIRYTRLS